MGTSPLEAIALLTCMVAVPSASAMAACWQPQEVKAAEVRNLHTMLMIGALRCRAGDAGMTERYNSFVTHNRNTLDTHNYVLKTRFMREYGIAGGHKAYDDFITGMANSHSGRLDDVKFCPTVDALTKLASDGSAADLEQLAANISEDTALTASQCKPEEVAAKDAQAGEPVPDPIVQRTIVEVPGDGTVTVHTGATPDLAAAPEIPAPSDAAAPARAEAAAAPAEAAAAAPVSQADALRAAVAALQTATAALQMASQTNTPPAAPAAEAKDVTVVQDAPVVPAEDPATP
jgi:hypothetical protein